MTPLSNWLFCQKKYQWIVDLKKFENAKEFSGYFIDIINPKNTRNFEDKFRQSVVDGFLLDQYIVCGEVYFWKNNKSPDKNAKTNEILQHLKTTEHQKIFIETLTELTQNPVHNNFSNFRNACDLPNGFASPITYLSFFQPHEYPMIDRVIANWWKSNTERFGLLKAPLFIQRKSDGWIQAVSKRDSTVNWKAYIAWKDFCNYYRKILTDLTKSSWRARDVEMAVWESQKRCLPLDKLT
jgi:hypothetical protein